MSVYTHNFFAMNTDVHMTLESSLPQDAIRMQLNEAEHVFRMVEATCSRFDPESELSFVNRQGGQAVQVSAMLYAVLEEAGKAWQATNGYFQPGVYDCLMNAGYSRSFERLTDEELPSASPVSPVVNELPYELVDPTQQIVRLKEGAHVDLGGIAKGWAADQAARLLESSGSGFVNAGGDIRIWGKRSFPFRIGIAHPLHPNENVAVLSMEDGGVATSSVVKRRWKTKTGSNHHLIDPFAGRPSETSILSATVTAPTAALADVWAKTVLLMGEEEGSRWIKSQKQRALLVRSCGTVRRI